MSASANVTDNVYEINGNEYRVGYGQEFGLECKTASSLRSEWLFESGVPGKSSKTMVNSLHVFVGMMQFLLLNKTAQVCMTTLQL